jgi:hypothetical protein
LRFGHGGFHGFQNLAHARGVALARCGQAHAARGALQQAGAQLFFQRSDMARDVGHGHGQMPRRSGETAFFHDRQKHPHGVQTVQHRPSFPW